MEKIPTAEEFATEFDNARMPRGVSYYQEIGELMIDFAKLHVEAALKAASETEVLYLRNGNAYTDEKAIINSYPLTNIK